MKSLVSIIQSSYQTHVTVWRANPEYTMYLVRLIQLYVSNLLTLKDMLSLFCLLFYFLVKSLLIMHSYIPVLADTLIPLSESF